MTLTSISVTLFVLLLQMMVKNSDKIEVSMLFGLGLLQNSFDAGSYKVLKDLYQNWYLL